MEIELFRADTKASKGLTAKHIADSAACYDSATSPAPIVFGHPTNDSPALGLIESVRVEGSKLFGKLANIAGSVVQDVRDRKILNRSIAFWDPHHPSNPNPGKYSIRHLGLLGGQAPAIPGMTPLRFSADDELEADPELAPADAIIFAVEEVPTGVQTITEPAPANKEFAVKTAEQLQIELDAANKLAADNAARADKLEADQAAAAATFAANETTRRETENAATIAGALAAGKILPAEEKDLAVLFNALPVEAMTFSVGDKEPRAVLAAFVDALPKRGPGATDKSIVPTTEFAATTDAKAKAEAAYAAANQRDANAHKAAA